MATSQQRADEALQAYWAAKKLLDDCFSFPTQSEADEVLRRVAEQMSCVCQETTNSPSSSLSSGAL